MLACTCACGRLRCAPRFPRRPTRAGKSGAALAAAAQRDDITLKYVKVGASL